MAHITHRTPWNLRILSLIVAGIGVYNVWLALDHVQRAGHYRDLGVSYPPLLRAVTALVWGFSLLALGGDLFRRRQWARRWIVVILSNYGAFGVLWLIVFARSDFGRARIPFQAVLAAALVAVVAWVMRWRRNRAAFGLLDPPPAGTNSKYGTPPSGAGRSPGETAP